METQSSGPDPSMDFIKPWMNIMHQLFQTAASGSPSGQAEDARERDGSSHISLDALIAIMKTWGTLASVMSEPAAASAMASGALSLPDIISKFFQTSFSSYLNSQAELSEKLKQMGKRGETLTLETLDKDSLKAWSDFYDKEVRRYLKIPQLGLVRFYQERFNQTIDRFNVFAASLTEFMQILLLPMEKAFKGLNDKIEEQVKNEALAEDPREYYRLWIKILEGHYMTLFKTKRYTGKLGETLKAYEEFVSARNQIFTDAMQALPIPTNKDLDEVYGELYQVKKRLRALERTNRKPSTGSGG